MIFHTSRKCFFRKYAQLVVLSNIKVDIEEDKAKP